jgi:hypothetical protein
MRLVHLELLVSRVMAQLLENKKVKETEYLQ